jgi:phosphate-selective porin OprO/OprP
VLPLAAKRPIRKRRHPTLPRGTAALTSRVNAIDTGVNWYLNHYVPLYFDWQHSVYNRPIILSANKSSRHNDLFWFRTQVFF